MARQRAGTEYSYLNAGVHAASRIIKVVSSPRLGSEAVHAESHAG